MPLALRPPSWLRVAFAVVVVALLSATFAATAAAQGGPCRYGRDPITQRCLAKPAVGPPPPTLTLTSVPAATVYAIAPKGEPCSREAVRRLVPLGTAGTGAKGSPALKLDYESGLRVGERAYCFVARNYAPARLRLTVPWVGATEADTVKLVPFAHLAVGASCRAVGAYPLQPNRVTLRIAKQGGSFGLPMPKRLPLRHPLAPGAYRFEVAAEHFDKLEGEVVVGAPGADDSEKLLCLRPDAVLIIRNKPGGHPLDGLILQVMSSSNRIIWQGLAPAGDRQVRVPVRSSDQLSFVAMVDEKRRIRIPNDVLQSTRHNGPAPHQRYDLHLRLPSAPAAALTTKDSEATSRACEKNTKYCASAAYLRVHHHRQTIQDKEVQKQLERGCKVTEEQTKLVAKKADPIRPYLSTSTLRSCLAYYPEANASAQLQDACERSRSPLSWLACTRLKQKSLSAKLFLTLDDYVKHIEESKPEFQLMFGIGGLMSIEEHPAVINRLFGGAHYLVNDWFSVGGALRMVEVAPLPASTPDGSAAGYKVFGGLGYELSVALHPTRWLRFQLAGFTTGYYTATGSTSGAYGTIHLALAEDDGVQHGLSLHGGVAYFPDVIQIDEVRETHGGRVAPVVGLGYAVSIFR